MADAKTKAAQYAKSAGRGLGAVVRVEEAVSSSPQPYRDNVPSAASMDKATSVPIQLGSTDLSVQVTVVYAFS